MSLLIKKDSSHSFSSFLEVTCLPFIHDQDARPQEKKENQMSSPHHHSPSGNNLALVDVFGLDHMKLPFPYKLHILLCDMEITGQEHIISWIEDGRAFKIHDQKQFETLIQPLYFRQSKIASFIRQCYMYGFSKIEGGPSHRGSYLHPDFQRNKQEQSLTIQRRQKSVVDSSLQKTHKNQRRHRHHALDSSRICKENIVHYTRLSGSSSSFIREGRMIRRVASSYIIERGQDDVRPQLGEDNKVSDHLWQSFSSGRPSSHLTLNNKKTEILDSLVAENDPQLQSFSFSPTHQVYPLHGLPPSTSCRDDLFDFDDYDITTAFLEPSPIEVMLSKQALDETNTPPGRS